MTVVVVVVDFNFLVVVGLIRFELRRCGCTRFVGAGPSGSNDSSGIVSTGAKNLLSPQLV